MFSTYQRLGLSIHATPRQVIRAARTKLRKGVLRDPCLRHKRHVFYRQMLRHHKDAQRLVTYFRL